MNFELFVLLRQTCGGDGVQAPPNSMFSLVVGLIKLDRCAWRRSPLRTLDAPSEARGACDLDRTVEWKEGGGERSGPRGV